MSCLCRCWPMPWSSGHREPFVPSSSSTRATLVHWVACCLDWTQTFSSSYSVRTRLYFYPRIMTILDLTFCIIKIQIKTARVIAKCSVTTSTFASLYFTIFVSISLCGSIVMLWSIYNNNVMLWSIYKNNVMLWSIYKNNAFVKTLIQYACSQDRCSLSSQTVSHPPEKWEKVLRML